MARHFVDLFDIDPAEARELLDLADLLKREQSQGNRPARLPGRTLGMVFEKPSLRTRVSFEAAIARLGGHAITLRGEDVGLGVRETIADFARVVSQYVDAFAVRTFSHATIEELALHATIPVINALSDSAHPCQALADVLTIRETFGRLEGIKLVFVGDGNNVARSLAVAGALLGIDFVLSCPKGYEFPKTFQDRYQARFPDRPLRVEHDPWNAVLDADVVYTDVWASMGQETEIELRKQVFTPYRVDASLFATARSEAIFLHCLPARRGEETTAEVLDGPRSLVIPQAANRLHFQEALLVWLLSAEKPTGES